MCGDKTVNKTAGEVCDDGGETPACNANCTASKCGDSMVNKSAGEVCDDGNAINTDACVGNCVAAKCGDGFVQAGAEECDDGNAVDNDACSNTCKVKVACAGWSWNGGCWYTAAAVNMSCTQVCAAHGGFNAATSTHAGNQAGMHFWPAKANGSNWVNIECSSTDNNTNWGANGQAPDPNWVHPACYVNCSCNN
jgi:cysteine-rich repeat protein